MNAKVIVISPRAAGEALRRAAAGCGQDAGRVYAFRRQPRASRAVARANAALQTTAATTSEVYNGDSWKPVIPALVASTR
jgi:hypothetical protein